MVLKREVVERRLEELDVILEELAKHRGVDPEAYARDLGLQWKVERGLLAAAGVVFDVADHILAGHFGEQAETYEESLSLLRDRDVLSPSLYDRTKGLGGFRNVLVHRYLDIDPNEVLSHLDRAFDVLPAFAREVMDWLDEVPDEER